MVATRRRPHQPIALPAGSLSLASPATPVEARGRAARAGATVKTTTTTTAKTMPRLGLWRLAGPLAILALTLQASLLVGSVGAIDLSRLYGHMANPIQKRSDACHPYEPFKCPGDGNCISIQYLCDGAPDCSDGYDEDMRLCTADLCAFDFISCLVADYTIEFTCGAPTGTACGAKRPPVEETASFLQSLIASHGPNYLEKLFGSKARDALAPLGGVEKVAIALSESQTIEDFGAALHLMRSDLEHLRSVFMAVENGDLGMLKSLGIKDSELGDVKFFLEKLVNTGFLD